MLSLQEWQLWIEDVKRTGITDQDLRVLAEALDFSEQPLPERPGDQEQGSGQGTEQVNEQNY